MTASSIVERLRAVDYLGDPINPDGEEAATLITQLQAEIARLQAPEKEGYAPCPTCRQYSHSIGEDQVALIVRRMQDGWNNKQIAADLPVTHSMVSLIRLGRMWGPTTAKLGWKPKAREQAA